MGRKVTVICGSTSTGKSNFTFDLVKKSPPSLIISADSRQFYKDIPIISGQDNINKIPKHSLLVGQGFLGPNDSFSISQFKRYFLTQTSIFSTYNLYVVGGSGLYLKALTENLNNIEVPPNQKLRDQLSSKTVPQLQEKLKVLDEEKYSKMNNSDINNPRRLVRYIELSMSNRKKQKNNNKILDFEFEWIGLRTDIISLEGKIKNRVISRIEAGAIAEVEELQKNYPNKELPIYTTLGVSQIIDFLSKKIDKTTMIKTWTTAELQYAKRQMVWFKKQPQIVWYDIDI